MFHMFVMIIVILYNYFLYHYYYHFNLFGCQWSAWESGARTSDRVCQISSQLSRNFSRKRYWWMLLLYVNICQISSQLFRILQDIDECYYYIWIFTKHLRKFLGTFFRNKIFMNINIIKEYLPNIYATNTPYFFHLPTLLESYQQLDNCKLLPLRFFCFVLIPFRQNDAKWLLLWCWGKKTNTDIFERGRFCCSCIFYF